MSVWSRGQGIAGAGVVRGGFTLIELLVVISIIALLLSLLLAALGVVHATAQRVPCISNVRQLTIAWENYAADHRGRLVRPHTGGEWDWVGNDHENRGRAAQLQGLVGQRFFDYAGDVEVYLCPADPRDTYVRSYSISHFAGPGEHQRMDQIDRPSRTLVFLEEDDPRGRNANSWVMRTDVESWIDWPANFHPDGNIHSYADGSARYYVYENPETALIRSFNASATGCPDWRYFRSIYGPAQQP